jgi:hypothetical protein
MVSHKCIRLKLQPALQYDCSSCVVCSQWAPCIYSARCRALYIYVVLHVLIIHVYDTIYAMLFAASGLRAYIVHTS